MELIDVAKDNVIHFSMLPIDDTYKGGERNLATINCSVKQCSNQAGLSRATPKISFEFPFWRLSMIKS